MCTELPSDVTITYSRQYRRCGKPNCLLCATGGRGHGPYWYAYWSEGGRTRSRYLGKQRPDGVPPQDTADPAERSSAPARQPAGPGLRVQTLGGFALWRGQKPVPVERWEQQQSGVLLKWLLGAPGHQLARDVIVERFWPEGNPEQGRANLRVLVHRLRKVLDQGDRTDSDIKYNGETLSFSPSSGQEHDWLDADVFERAARAALSGRDAAACRTALALYTGDYLPGDAYEEVAVERREALRQRRLALLLHLAALCGSEEVEEAEASLRTVLTIDPCHEPAAVALMNLYAAVGRPHHALRVYRRLAEALHEDLALAPEAETQALARTLAVKQPAAPAPAIPELAPNNVPAPLSSFIGRNRELAELRSLLEPARGAGTQAAASEAAGVHRLITLTGPGGVGKTRLALRLADELLDAPGAFPDGIWLVELASLADAAFVPKAVATVLQIQEETARPLADTLATQLKAKRLLLLLDNCEHLVEACADLVAGLLRACPALQVLATSRASLNVPGERPWSVPALSLPEGPGSSLVGNLLESDAVRLFLDRARVHRPELRVTEENATAVARICRQLEGIPLALELAAARVSVLSLDQLAIRMRDSFRLLTGGPRTAPQRHQTLRATLDWSYQLLTEAEQALLRRLAVFAGGCTLDAAEAVCAGDVPGTVEVLDLLDSLVRQSLLQMNDTAGEARYSLLEIVRHYGQALLAASGERASLEQRHDAYYLGLAEAAERALTGPDQVTWLVRLEAEHDNLRAVLHRAQECGKPLLGLRVAGALWRFWDVRGYVSEGRRWLDALLVQNAAQQQPAPACSVRAKALNAAGNLAFAQDDYARAYVLHRESLALRRELADKQGISISLNNLGNLAFMQGDLAQAQVLQEESLSIDRELDDRWGAAGALNNLGRIAYVQGDYERAAMLHEESLALRRELADGRGIAYSLANLGKVAYAQGHYPQAVSLHKESLSLSQDLSDKRGIAYALANLGNVAAMQGDGERALALHRESVVLHQELGDNEGIAANLEGIAQLAAAPGTAPERAVRAARFLGAAAALRRAIGAPLHFKERDDQECIKALVQAALPETIWASAWLEGERMPLEELLASIHEFPDEELSGEADSSSSGK